MPLALREGMACGLPAISSKLLGLHETVSEGTGWLAEAGNADAVAEAMQRMMDLSVSEHGQMARSARFKAESEFSLEHEVVMLSGWMQEARRGIEAGAGKVAMVGTAPAAGAER
jgi:glycosyltransferase involved in cell wall biosynthesis